MKKRTASLLFTAALIGIAPLGYAAQSDAPRQESGTAADKPAHKDLTDAADALKDYTADKRDEAARKAKAALDDLDAHINTLEQRIDRNWDHMDRAAREQARRTLTSLHEQRIKVAEWYGGLKNSTTHAWGHMKKGFSDAYENLRHAWEKAEQEYKGDGRK